MADYTQPSDTETDPPENAPREHPPRAKWFAAGVLSAAALFGAAVVFGGLWLTGQWNGPSADDPAESVDGFLTALLTDHDATDAQAYTCASQSGDLGQVVDRLDDAEQEAQFSWAKVTTVEKTDANAVVTAKITHDLTGETATWTFALATGDPDEAWRVCGVYTDSDDKS